MNTLLRYFLGLVLALGLLATSHAQAFVGISVGIAPPPLPFYAQPACPGDGYMWTPGYWAWDPDVDQYYWVPGTWVMAPEIGFLWTPCWWGWQDGAYCFHNGYWGRDVGFYGGINYGYGYNGRGYDGGRWRGNHFERNAVADNARGSRTSFNGHGGVNAVATADERRAAGEHHVAATNAQNAEVRSARVDPGQRFSANHGNPAVTGTARAGSFRGSQANAATGATRGRTSADDAFTGGESRTASTEHANRTNGGNAATGENRTASTEHATRTSGEDAFTGGESHTARTASTQHTSSFSPAEQQHASQAAAEQRRATETRNTNNERTAAIERSRSNESHVAQTPSHEPVSHASSFHASSVHSSGGGGHSGGGSFAHASVSHSSGGGGSHASGGGHSGGGGGHSAGGGGHK